LYKEAAVISVSPLVLLEICWWWIQTISRPQQPQPVSLVRGTLLSASSPAPLHHSSNFSLSLSLSPPLRQGHNQDLTIGGGVGGTPSRKWSYNFSRTSI
jgi:hypothetical protein